jgi:hypothetical protein
LLSYSDNSRFSLKTSTVLSAVEEYLNIDYSKGEQANFCTSEVQKYQEVPRSTKKYREVPRSTEKYREVPRSTEKYQEVPRSTEKYRKVQRSTKEVRFIPSLFIHKQKKKCSVIAQYQKLYYR